VLGLIEALGRVPRSRLLDRLIQGRISIAFVAFALIGIVTMQLGLLKLNAGIGRALEHEALLQRENAALSIENSELAAGDRVELQAGRLGMGLTSPGDLRFLTLGSPSFEARRAAAALTAPVASFTSATTASATTGEGISGANESEAAATGSGEAGSGASSATVASSTPSESSTSPSGIAGDTSASEAASAASSTPPAGAGETSGSAPPSGVSAPSSSGPSGGAAEAVTAASPAPAGGGATAPSG
jgi:hypothetical protein